MPDKYESFARVFVDTDPLLKPLMKGMTPNVDVRRQIEVMKRILVSRPNLEKVMRMTDLDLTVDTPETTEKLLKSLEERLVVQSQGFNLVRIAFDDTDPQLAKNIVQAVVSIFIENNLGRNRKDLAGARKFIDEQIREYELELEAAEQRRADFKRKNMGALPGDKSYFEQVAGAKKDYEDAKSELEELTARHDMVSGQLTRIPKYLTVTAPVGPPISTAPDGAETSSRAVSLNPVGNINQRIATAQQTLSRLLSRFTDKHPDVVRVQRDLNALIAERDKFMAALEAGNGQEEGGDAAAFAPGNATASNPVYVETKLHLFDLEAELSVLRPRVAAKLQKLNELKNRAQTIPVVEAEMSKMNRDYSVIKANYEQMLARREQARIEQNIETKSERVSYNLIEPPQVPLQPSSPNRPVFLTLVLVMAIGSGLALAFIMSQIQGTFSSVQALREMFTVPVLGAVTVLVSEADRRRRRFEIATFGVTIAGLFLAYGGVIAMELVPHA